MPLQEEQTKEKILEGEEFHFLVLPPLAEPALDSEYNNAVTRRQFSELLKPQDSDDANDGTFIALNNTPGIQFADAATKVAYFAFIPPFDLTIQSLQFIWSTPATTGDLRWQIDLGEGGISEVTNARITGGTAVTTSLSTTFQAANDLNYTEILNKAAGVNLGALRKGNLWGIKFTRLGADAADTLTSTVNLYGILVKYI